MQTMKRILPALAVLLILQTMCFAQNSVTGIYDNTEEILKGITLNAKQIPENNPPVHVGTCKYEIVAGTKICFTLPPDESQIIKSVNKKSNIPDTVSVAWNHGNIKGSAFKIIDTKDRLQKYQFCWVPKASEVSNIPYTLSMSAFENSDTLNAVSLKIYSILVKARAENSSKTGRVNSETLFNFIKLYPNPVIDILFVKTSFNQPYKLEIVNSLGQMVMMKSMGQNKETINVSELPKGIYSVIVKKGNDILVQKFMKTVD